MGIFDGAFYDPLSAGGVLGYGMQPQGNFVGGGRSVIGDILERIRAGAARGMGAADFGVDSGIAPALNYQPQQLPGSPVDLALGVNRPQYAPTLPAPTNVASMPPAPPGVPQGATPQLGEPPPANAQFIQQQGFGQPPPQAATPAATPSSFSQKLAQIAGLLDPSQRPETKVLTDMLGNQTIHLVNPVTGEVRVAPMAKGGAGSSGIPDIQGSMNLPPQVNPTTGRDENFINSLGPVLGAQVTSALNGDSKLDGRMLQRIQPLAARAEPGWTQQTYAQRLAAYKSFYGGGKDQETGRALNQSAGHFRELVDQMPGLPGTQVPLFNWAKNTVDTQVLGKGTANNFIINAHALADELSRLFKQVNMSDTEIRAWESKLSPNMSQEQQQGMVRTLHGLYDEAFQALEKKRQDGLGPALAAKAPPLANAHTVENLNRIKQFGIGTPQAAQPGVTSTGVKWSVAQ